MDFDLNEFVSSTNRTNLELKHGLSVIQQLKETTTNRTNLELKR